MSYDISAYDFAGVEWTAPSSSVLSDLANCTIYPWDKLDPVLVALTHGATFAQAATAGGLSAAELGKVMEWGAQGHVAFVDFRSEMLKADYDSVKGTMKKMQEKSEGGDIRASESFLKFKSKEYRILHNVDPSSVVAQERGGGGVINVQINTGFGDAPQLTRPEAPRLVAVETVEAEVIEDVAPVVVETPSGKNVDRGDAGEWEEE